MTMGSKKAAVGLALLFGVSVYATCRNGSGAENDDRVAAHLHTLARAYLKEHAAATGERNGAPICGEAHAIFEDIRSRTESCTLREIFLEVSIDDLWRFDRTCGLMEADMAGAQRHLRAFFQALSAQAAVTCGIEDRAAEEARFRALVARL